MFLITAIINEEALMDIFEDLKASNIEGVTISRVHGKGQTIEFFADIEEHIRLDIVVPNQETKELAKDIIRTNARDVQNSTGKIWVTPVLEVERIRTGEVGEDALSHAKSTHISIVPKKVYYAEDTPAS